MMPHVAVAVDPGQVDPVGALVVRRGSATNSRWRSTSSAFRWSSVAACRSCAARASCGRSGLNNDSYNYRLPKLTFFFFSIFFSMKFVL